MGYTSLQTKFCLKTPKLTVRDVEKGGRNIKQCDVRVAAAALDASEVSWTILGEAPSLTHSVTDRSCDSAVNGQKRQFYN